MSIYRRIYKNHYGSIPHDSDGRSYDIHHIDGNRKNNDISNLLAVSVHDHYKIHLEQGDYAACLKMADRIKIPPEEKSQIAKLSANKRVQDGTHNFLGTENNQRRLDQGTHHLLGPAHNRKQLEKGTHHFLTLYTCPHCGRNGKGPSMKNNHFDNCKKKSVVSV